ncbi:hypothetical protein JAAARDRAFT_190495 [Jaapia argillacea MUCL 33604]|uniref:Uncharacterized protein n=1 Tax=Jaapia argillacea MUCL 33604 TaxID=933084 RepID=A0A067Q449_9AGAM|nr:hypothetical protein JAAARDRAFT_190495 [Jaapia argillacea MUCL 33604]
MHPHYYGGYGRRPARLFWFILGGLATAWWFKSHENRSVEGWKSRCRRVKEAPVDADPPTAGAPPYAPPPSIQAQAQARFEDGGSPTWGTGQPGQQQAAPQYVPANWEEEKERMMAMKAKASDTMTEISEATLDGILSTVSSLKSKLADHKARMEEEKKRQEQILEEQRRAAANRRWV